MNERPHVNTMENPVRVDFTIANADLNVTVRRAAEALNRLITQFNILVKALENYVTWPELWVWPGSENLIRAGELVTNALEVLMHNGTALANVGDIKMESHNGGANWITSTVSEGSGGGLLLGGASYSAPQIILPQVTSGEMVFGSCAEACFRTTAGVSIGPNDESNLSVDESGNLVARVDEDCVFYCNGIQAGDYYSADGTPGATAVVGADPEADPPIDGITFKNGLYTGGSIGTGVAGGILPPEDGLLYGLVNTEETGVYFELIPVLEVEVEGAVFGRHLVYDEQNNVTIGEWTQVPEEAPDTEFVYGRFWNAELEIMDWLPVVEECPDTDLVYGRLYNVEEDTFGWLPVVEECPDTGLLYGRRYDEETETWGWDILTFDEPTANGLVYGRSNTSPTGGQWILAVQDLAVNTTAAWGRTWPVEEPSPLWVEVVSDVVNPVAGAPYVRVDGDWAEYFPDATGEGAWGRSGGAWVNVVATDDFDTLFADAASELGLVIDVDNKSNAYARIYDDWAHILGVSGQTKITVSTAAKTLTIGLNTVNGVPSISGGLKIESGNLTLGSSYNIIAPGGQFNGASLILSGHGQMNTAKVAGYCEVNSIKSLTTIVSEGTITANGAGDGLIVKGNSSLQGTATIATLVVNGTSTLKGTVRVENAATFTSTVSVQGLMTVANFNCNVISCSGLASLESLSTIHGATIGTSLHVLGNCQFDTTLVVTGDVSAGTAHINGDTVGNMFYGDVFDCYRGGTSPNGINRAVWQQAIYFSAMYASGLPITVIGGINAKLAPGGDDTAPIKGTWAGEVISIGKGGTGLAAVGNNGQVLKSNGSAIVWGDASSAWPDDASEKSDVYINRLHVRAIIFES